MRGRRAWWIASFACSCTRANPLFGEGASAGDTEPTSGPGVSESSSSGAVTSASSSSDGSTAAEAETSTSSQESTTTHGVIDAGLECTLPEPLSLAIQVTAGGEVIAGPCDLFQAHGPMLGGGGVLSVNDCGSCQSCGGESIDVAFTGVDMPLIPACGTAVLWGASVEGACEWRGLVVYEEGTLTPYHVLSLQQSPSPSAVAGFPVQAQVLDACPSAECSEAASLRLSFPGNGDTKIEPDEAPKDMELSLPSATPGATWRVDNLESMIDGACGRHVAWTATRI